MIHDATGYWIREAGPPEPLPSLSGEHDFDVLIVGGGFTGMWTAWHLTEADPGLRIGLIESDRMGFGPSGRNGGFVETMWKAFRLLSDRYGPDGALKVAEAAEDSVGQIRDFCRERDLDVWFQEKGVLSVSTSPVWDGSWRGNLDAMRRAGAGDRAQELDPSEVAAICDSPAFRNGLFFETGANLQPARLGFGLRAALLEREVELYEHSPALTVDDGPEKVTIRTPEGRIRAERVVLANGGTLAGSGSPVRDAVTVASSHLVITEPIPDILEEMGWTGHQGIIDGRSLLTYFRTTPDGRLALGWGGGRILAGGRRRGRAEVDPDVTEEVIRILHRYFPATRNREVEYAWGGPIDASASHTPHVTRLPSGRTVAAFGFTGNGVGPTQMVGRTLASVVLERDDRYARLPIVGTPEDLNHIPPEPFRWVGAAVIRNAIARVEERQAKNLRPDPASVLITKVPELIGFHIGR